MAPPSSKRRKLRHSDESEDIDNSVGSFNSDASDTSANDSDEHDFEHSDASMDDVSPSGDVEASSNDGSHGEGSKEVEIAPTPSTGQKRQQPARTIAGEGIKQHKRSTSSQQDGIYTAEIFKSNMFKLQVDELLEQVKPRYKRKEAENAMRTLKELVEQIPSREPVTIPEAEKSMKSIGVIIPFPHAPPKDAMYKLQFDRPSNVNVTGSYALQIATRTEDRITMDMVVTMPKSIFQEKDYLNYRYFYKRAYYLACLAAAIKTSKQQMFEVSFDLLGGNPLQPVIVINPSGDRGAHDFSKSKCSIRILLSLPENTFPTAKLIPTSNCIRTKNDNSEPGPSTRDMPPTPFYNATLQSEVSVTAYLKLLHGVSTRSDAFKDACILGRVWLKQRGFGSRIRQGGFGNFEWSALMALLLQPGRSSGAPPLSSGYSSYQLFKATLQFLANHDLSKSPSKFQADDVKLPKGEDSPILFDGLRNINLLYKMTNWAYKRLQLEAHATIDMLSSSLSDHFELTFILKTNLLHYRYDAFFLIPAPSSVNYAVIDPLIESCSTMYNTLVRALTDRFTAVSFSIADEEPWKISTARSIQYQGKSILISIATHPVNANRTVDHGPAAEDKKAAASFRQFWGDKAELRRFKDGSILESLVWSVKDSSQSVIEQIVRYCLEKHCGISQEAKFFGDTFAVIIPHGRIPGQSSISAFSARMNALTNLEKHIRDLEGLPLQIRTIRAADPALRYATIDPENKDIPANLTIQFEGSARWPDDLCAIQRTKIAFLLKLSDLLTSAKLPYVTRVGLENPSQPSQNQAYLDIILSHTLTFRLRIHHDREPTLLQRQLKDKTLDGPSRESAASALALYKQAFIHTITHTQAVQILCTRFPALSPSIRLVKRWFGSHLLSPHFAPELIELFVVRNFLQPYPWPVPATATTGFLRTLFWLSRWDWRYVPLVVDFSSNFTATNATGEEDAASQTLKQSDIEGIQTRFEAWRRIDPAMNRVAIFAATNLDSEGTTWTDKGRPEKVVASRMTALAKAATNVIRSEQENLIAHLNGFLDKSTTLDLNNADTLFVSQHSDYDILLHMSPKFSPFSKSTKPAFKNLQLQSGALSSKDAQAIGFSPISLFLTDLQALYGDAIIWFYDPERLDVVAGLWNPGVVAQRGWKVKVGWNSVPIKGKNKKDGKEETVEVKVNKGGILSEIRRLGGDMVTNVEIK
ncbi:Nrap protein [Dendryphion nanum]|uniref:U3 small nucleolar RNA-associated protein 22 n=1 Tax=Dendryphion nanum TaxID=256645 RepID=A0A9P9EI38_9PLEO|nr:Nrap protein [Dendryphion nanum]